jgi:signal transduction histidine kinase
MIGLAITRDIIELMGGGISCSSELGVGTKMTFYVPTGIHRVSVDVDNMHLQAGSLQS